MSASPRIALLERTAKPTGEFRRRAWRTFQHALERHLAQKNGSLTPLETQR